MSKLFNSIIILSLLGFLSCKTQLEIAKPVESYTPPTVETKPSTINAAININIPQLEKSINNSLKGVIYDDKNIEDDDMTVQVTKLQDIKISINKNKITYTLPLKLAIKYRIKQSVLGVEIKDTYNANGAIKVSLSSTFSIEKNWKIKTTTTIENYSWIEKPTVQLAGMKMPITTIADIAISQFKKDITTTIDQSITDLVDLPTIMNSMWETMQQPIEVDNNYKIWLRMQPQKIYSSPIVGNGNTLGFSIGMQSFIETSVGSKLEPLAKKTKLPAYQVQNTVAPDFSINSNISVTYNQLTEIAKQSIVGQEFTQGRKKVIIDSVNVFGQNNNLIVAIRVKGSANGLVFCTGALHYNDSLQALQITNFDYTIDTKNALLKSTNWLLHKNFLKMIEPMLTIPLKESITESITETNTMLKNYELYKGITLKGKLHDLQITSVYNTPQAIIIHGNVKGVISIELGDVL
jgi:hypothetical protein